MKQYRTYFKLCEQDKLFCEFEFVVHGLNVEAKEVEEIDYGSRDITNMIALSDISLTREQKIKIHNEFLNHNPYQL